MVRTDRWKYIFWEGVGEQLFDLENDPAELRDLARKGGSSRVRAEHRDQLFAWMRSRKLSVTVPDDRIVVSRHTIEPKHGIEIGVW